MTLRRKLLAAQLPMAAALVLVSVLFYQAVQVLGVSSQSILKDNFRSVLAAQRMTHAIDALDAWAVAAQIGTPDHSLGDPAMLESHFEGELEVQEGNITEPGEREATRRVRQAWDRYRRAFDQIRRDPALARTVYPTTLAQAVRALRAATENVMALNVDPILRKNDEVRARVANFEQILVLAALAACGMGLGLSASLTARLLRPLGMLSQTVQRVGEGDLGAKLLVDGRDELAGLARDINTMTERLRRYRDSSLGELLEAQQAAQAAIDSLADPVMVFDADGKVTNANQSAEGLFGAEAGAPLSESKVDPELREAIERLRAHLLGGKGAYVPKGFEEGLRVQSPGGERWFLPRGHPVYSAEGAVAGATVVLQDVTRIRVFDELKNDLVATVAHEFRTPLTSLRMAIHLCLEGLVGPVTEKQADLLQSAREDCERLQTIVDDLLNVARLRSGQAGVARRECPVEELLALAADYRKEAEEKGLELRIEPAPQGLKVDADPDRIALVFANLIANAVQHTPAPGSIDVRVRPDNGWIRFEVADTGPGVPPEFRARIFDRFFQVPGASSGAAGLGLYIAREVVRAHGGEMGVDSEFGHGSRFWFTLPAPLPDSVPARQIP